MTVSRVGLGRVILTAALLGGLGVAATQSSAVIDLGGDRPAGGQSAEGDAPGRTSAVVTCVGPELSGVKGAPDVPQELSLAAEAAPAEVSGTADPGTLAIGIPGAAVAPATERSTAATLTAPVPATVTATGGFAPGLAALQQFRTDGKDLRGLSTLPCGTPVAEGWLVAGGGAPGRQERLLLANPGANEVTVDVSVLGANGPVTSDAGRGVVVPARGRANVLLDAIASGDPSPVVHVDVRGGAVVAALSDVWLDGSVAAGLDATPLAATPATALVVPGVSLEQAGILRVAVPGETQSVVSVTLLSTSGSAPLPGGVRTIPGRASADVPLADVPPGTYALAISADVPVVAAAFAQARQGTAPGEFAWTPATPAVTTLAGVPLGAGPAASAATGSSPAAGAAADQARRLALVPSGAATTARVITRVGAELTSKDVALAADRLTLVDLGAAESVWVVPADPSAGVHASVLTSTGSGASRMLASAPLADLAVATERVRARPLP